MGARGPAPKRSDQRRRANKPEVPVSQASGAVEVEAPKANSKWHPTAKRWFESLAESGQSVFYEPSDWAAAYVLAETMSRGLKPRVVGTTDEGEPVTAHLPPSGAELSAWLKGMASLLVTEADRRRASVELQRPREDGETETAEVTDIRSWREGLSG